MEFPYGWNQFANFREDKMLLVIDDKMFVEYSLVNTSDEFKALRPLFREFLCTVYQYFDIILWSSIDGGLFNDRMESLGILYSNDYNILLTVDMGSCFIAEMPDKSLYQVKLLEYIWEGLPQYNSSNTVMIVTDQTNFICNEVNSINIEPYDKSYTQDCKLLFLERYLELLALSEQDVTIVNQQFWMVSALRIELYFHREKKMDHVSNVLRSHCFDANKMLVENDWDVFVEVIPDSMLPGVPNIVSQMEDDNDDITSSETELRHIYYE